MNRFLEDFQGVSDSIMEFASGKSIYVSIDIGVVDPAFAPATDSPEPGGFTSREFVYFLQRINKIKGLRVVDLVEINPSKDSDGRTVKLGAKILGEFI